MELKFKSQIMDANGITRALSRLASQIVERNVGTADLLVTNPDGQFQRVAAAYTYGLNTGDDPATEVARLRALGATPADVGQGDAPWTVLADPAGNEFCVLTPL